MSLRVLERAEGHTVASDIDAALKRSLAETSRALESAIAELRDYSLDDSALLVLVEPGSAPPGDIADILSDLSILYRKLGGTGINFAFQEVHVVAEEFV
jgi:hypothetical protein